jgi:hypothetical protein
VNLTDIEHMASLCPHLLTECNDPEPPTDLAEIVEFTQQLLDLPDNAALVEAVALRHDCITNNLNCPFDDDNEMIKSVVRDADNDDAVELTKENLVPYINKTVFRAAYLRNVLSHKVNSEDEDEEEEKEQKTWCDAVLTNNYFQMELCQTLRQCVVFDTLDRAYTFVSKPCIV